MDTFCLVTRPGRHLPHVLAEIMAGERNAEKTAAEICTAICKNIGERRASMISADFLPFVRILSTSARFIAANLLRGAALKVDSINCRVEGHAPESHRNARAQHELADLGVLIAALEDC